MADLAQLARKWNRHADEMTLIAPCRSERLEADVMRRCAAELLVALSDAALSHAAGQEVDDSLPRPLWPVSKEWYRLCERRFAVDRITISGKLAEAIVDAVCGPAIAAQRKEGA